MGPLAGIGGACLPALCWDSERAPGLASHVVSWIWVLFFCNCSICPPPAPHQQLVAYCFFKTKVDFNAVNLSCSAKTRLLVSCEILLLFSQSLMAVTAPGSIPPAASAGSRCGPGPTPPHCAPLKPTCLPHLHTGGMSQGRT